MKKILNAFVFIVILGLIYGGLFFAADKFNLLLTPLFSMFTALILLFGISGLTYNYLWNLNRLKKRPWQSTVIILFCLVILNYFSKINLQVYVIFKHISTTEGKHWAGKVFQSDPVLGHVPVKCLSGSLSLEYNHSLIHHVPVKFDENGFRIAADTSCDRAIKRPLVLFLGCSFTEGADCPAEKTFSSIVGDSLHGSSINAGVSSYGFSQMLLLARTLVPKYKPDYVVVQNSPWLSERAVDRYAPTFGLSIPAPYFAKVHDSVVILPPAFPTLCFSLNWKYDTNKNRIWNYISFYFNEGFKLCAKDWWNMVLTKYNTPKPIKDRREVEQVFFEEMSEITKKYNDKMIVLNLGDIQSTSSSHTMIKDKNVKFAEADSLMWKTANYDKKAFERANFWWGWTGKDSIIIDKHPTTEAHAIIAQSILQTIKN